MVVVNTLPVALAASMDVPETRPPPKPHVLFALADDYGWANLGLHRHGGQGAAEAHTPVLDGLAHEGIVLARYYTYKICSPSRSALQSGRLPVHVNTDNSAVQLHNASDPVSGYAGIPRNMTCVANKLSAAGYRAHFVGKWDAGMATSRHIPIGRGYSTWYGYYQHANDCTLTGFPAGTSTLPTNSGIIPACWGSSPVIADWRKDMGSGVVEGLQATGEVDVCLNKFLDFSEANASYEGGVRDAAALSDACENSTEAEPPCYEEELFKQRSLRIIEQHPPSTPLFLFHAFHSLHTPLQVPRSYLSKVASLAEPYRFDDRLRWTYAAMALYMDGAVGQMVGALKAKAMWEHTLMAFASDNGGPIYQPAAANNHPLRGGKYSDWEGGVRVNAFVSGGYVPAERRGERFDGLFSVADWYTTLCDLAGTDPFDHEANATNTWLAARALPTLPPVDGISQWPSLMGARQPVRQEVHLSDSAIIVSRGTALWKLVKGVQPYSGWTGEVYPNCSAGPQPPGVAEPVFVDLKVLGERLNASSDAAEQALLTWGHDCTAGCLYDVAVDPTEHQDRSVELPAMHAELSELLRERNLGNFHPARGTYDIAACREGLRNGGYYGPFVDAAYSPTPKPSPAQRARNALYDAEITALHEPTASAVFRRSYQRLYQLSLNTTWRRLDQCVVEAGA